MKFGVALLLLAAQACAASVAGTYRCFSMNVGGRGGRCSSSSIVLNDDGTYSMAKEKGTYSVKDVVVTLSESKLRGPGKLGGDGRLVFEFTYKGLKQTVTYVRQAAAKEEAVRTEAKADAPWKPKPLVHADAGADSCSVGSASCKQ